MFRRVRHVIGGARRVVTGGLIPIVGLTGEYTQGRGAGGAGPALLKWGVGGRGVMPVLGLAGNVTTGRGARRGTVEPLQDRKGARGRCQGGHRMAVSMPTSLEKALG